jgi:hypothetical protein
MASFFSDLFGGADNAAQDQIKGIQAGQQQAQGNIATGNQALQTNYAAALQPFQQNFGNAQQGVGALGNVLGLNGPAGTQSALTALQTTPGYQFQLGSGENAVKAAAQAGGTGDSGNEAIALQNMGQNLAGTTYNNYVSQLQPYLGYSTQGATGIAGVDTGLGSGLNANQNTLAGLNMGANVGIGNANASADLANQSLGLGLLGGAAKGLTTAIPGSSILGSLGSLFSDERLKEDIEPVGELYDGQQIYRYNYIGDDTPRIGLMAQEVAVDNPDAVHEIGGWLAVNYGAATERAAELARFLDAA